MDQKMIEVAKACLDGAENDTKTFPEILGILSRAGFEGYAIDFRRRLATYYTQCGSCVDLQILKSSSSISSKFDAKAIKTAILEAQRLASGYTYNGFCDTIVAAGCAGYLVSILGRRAVYIGRTAETHVECIPQ